MSRRKLSSYSPEEIIALKTKALEAAKVGMLPVQAADYCGLSTVQLDTLLKEDAEFAGDFRKVRAEAVKEISGKMHNLAGQGNFQAMQFVLDRDPLSPFNEANALDPKQSDALQKLLVHLSNNNGLLPPVECPQCHQIIES
jgi:hypothetical protein